MIRYFGGRLLQIFPVLFGVSLVVFFLVRLIPGDPAVATLGSRATPQLIARVRDQLGLDLPLWQQYLNFLSHALQGDFGRSYIQRVQVGELIWNAIPISAVVTAAYFIGE